MDEIASVTPSYGGIRYSRLEELVFSGHVLMRHILAQGSYMPTNLLVVWVNLPNSLSGPPEEEPDEEFELSVNDRQNVIPLPYRNHDETLQSLK
jgi:hypothetical protein